MNTHAIGDSTVSVLLNEYKKILKDIDDPRWRIEHSQVVDINEFELYNEKFYHPFNLHTQQVICTGHMID